MKKTKRRPTFLREWRKLRDMTQADLAERLGLTQETISRIERGEIAYTQPVLEAAAGALGCEPADLLRPPNPAENELTTYVRGLNPKQKKQALRILKAALGDEGDSDEEEAAA